MTYGKSSFPTGSSTWARVKSLWHFSNVITERCWTKRCCFRTGPAGPRWQKLMRLLFPLLTWKITSRPSHAQGWVPEYSSFNARHPIRTFVKDAKVIHHPAFQSPTCYCEKPMSQSGAQEGQWFIELQKSLARETRVDTEIHPRRRTGNKKEQFYYVATDPVDTCQPRPSGWFQNTTRHRENRKRWQGFKIH